MKASSWAKAVGGGALIMIGGPMLIRYVQPSEEELFKRYNPELQKRSLEGRDERLREANEFIDRLKEYSRDDRPSEFDLSFCGALVGIGGEEGRRVMGWRGKEWC